MAEHTKTCDMGGCDTAAVIEVTGSSGRSWRTARACDEHAQHLTDYCAKPVEQWRDDYQPIAMFNHETREWDLIPTEDHADG